MVNLNRATIIGNLTRDPEVRSTPSGQTVATLGVATSRSWVNQAGVRQEETEFHSVVAWGRLAEICQQYMHKGMRVYVEGRIKTRSWDDQTGNKRYRTEIIAEGLIMLDRAPHAGAGQVARPDQPAAMPESSAPHVADMPMDDGEIKVEEIPF
jgi:single-strand DNA-binding protein